VSYAGLARKTSHAHAESAAAPRVFSGGLRIGETNDVYEQEADRVSEEVMTGSATNRHWSLLLVHESEHVRFREAYAANTLLNNVPACGNNLDALLAMNELAAMLTEFRLRMERIRGSVSLSSPDDKAMELEEWRDHRIRGTSQSITVSLRTVRCVCQCDDANKMIKETVEFATSSWTQQEKNDLHREMRDPMWTDLDLRWPFVAPPIPNP
jgi:hypothetical protein